MLKIKDIKVGSILELNEDIYGFDKEIYRCVVLTKPKKKKTCIECNAMWIDQELYGLTEKISIFNSDSVNWTKIC